MTKNLIYISIIFIFLFGCKTIKKVDDTDYLKYLHSTKDYVEVDSILKIVKGRDSDSLRASYTTLFYDIELKTKPAKKIFKLSEQKLFSLEIVNYGTKDFYVPEWLKKRALHDKNELTTKIFRKNRKRFKEYIQASAVTKTYFQPKFSEKRNILSTKNGKKIFLENLEIDTFKKIVDPGEYIVEIHIDLSNFGYFKTLKSHLNFKVIR